MKITYSVIKGLGFFVIAVGVLMMLLTCSDVFMRYLFRAPIIGTTEITEYLMVCMVLAMGWTAIEERHVVVDLVMNRFPKRVQAIVDSFNLLVSLGLYAIVAWQAYAVGMVYQKYGVVSALLDIPKTPFVLLMGLGFAILCVAIVPLLVKKVMEAARK